MRNETKSVIETETTVCAVVRRGADFQSLKFSDKDFSASLWIRLVWNASCERQGDEKGRKNTEVEPFVVWFCWNLKSLISKSGYMESLRENLK
jgi:hypothetical protein